MTNQTSRTKDRLANQNPEEKQKHHLTGNVSTAATTLAQREGES